MCYFLEHRTVWGENFPRLATANTVVKIVPRHPNLEFLLVDNGCAMQGHVHRTEQEMIMMVTE